MRLRAPLTGDSYPAVTPRVPAAHWFEREIHDLSAIVPEGHPRLEPLVRHAPERARSRCPTSRRSRDPSTAARSACPGPGVFVIPYGPVRSGVFEAAQFLVQTGGEDVAYCAQRLFFKRRGAERRICEVPLELAVLVAERVSGTSSVAHALAFSHAVESLSRDRGAAARAQAIRRVLAELERLYNHLEVTVRECEDASLSVAQAQFAVLKERLHRLAGAVVGNRYLRGAVVPGGTRIDLDAGRVDLIGATLRDWERDLGARARGAAAHRLVPGSPGQRRPAVRAGRPRLRLRRTGRPRLGDRLSTRAATFPTTATRRFEVARHSDGDAMARMEVRFQEVEHLARADPRGARLARPGPGAQPPRRRSSTSRALGAAESARGETLYWLEADGPACAALLQAAGGVVRQLRDLQPGVRLAGADRLLVHRAQSWPLAGGVRRMIRWFLRGVAPGRLTTRYPRGRSRRRPASAPERCSIPSAVDRARRRALRRGVPARRAAARRPRRLRLDAGRCIGCGLCVEAARGRGRRWTRLRAGGRSRQRLVVGDRAAARPTSHRSSLGGAFRRSLHIRHVDAGSDGAVEQELAALLNPYYDMQRLGLFFTASPRHADVLLVTGPVTAPMEEPLRRTYEAMPEPRVVVAAGTDACSGGIWTAPEVLGGVDRVLPVDVYIPGDPPSPIALLHGLLLAGGRVQEARRAATTDEAAA